MSVEGLSASVPWRHRGCAAASARDGWRPGLGLRRGCDRGRVPGLGAMIGLGEHRIRHPADLGPGLIREQTDQTANRDKALGSQGAGLAGSNWDYWAV